MNRRGFLQRFGGVLLGAVAAVYCPAILEDIFESFPNRPDITVLPPDDPNCKLGWIIYEEVEIVVVNERAINKISI